MIYNILIFMIIIIATASGIFLLTRRRRRLLYASMAVVFFYFAVIYILSLLGVPTFVTNDTLTLGAWVRPLLPILLASPFIFCHD